MRTSLEPRQLERYIDKYCALNKRLVMAVNGILMRAGKRLFDHIDTAEIICDLVVRWERWAELKLRRRYSL